MASSIRSSLLLAFSALTLLSITALAQAEPDTLTVVNGNGVPQAGVYVSTTSGENNQEEYGMTNGAGQIVIDPLTQIFTTFTFTRSYEIGDPCYTAPEGAGVSSLGSQLFYEGLKAKPNPTLTLPAVPTTPTDPGISPVEMGMVGLINHYRREEGAPAVTISSTLSASADRYLSAIPSRPLNYDSSATYCFASGPGIRAVDAGFPTAEEISEAVMRAPTPNKAFDRIVEGGYSAAITDYSVTMVGIANAGDTWVIDATTLTANQPHYARAGDTGLTGDDSLLQVAGKENASAKKAPRLKFKRVVAKGKKVKAILRVAPKARGKVKAVAYFPNGKGLQLRCKRKKGKVTCTRRLFAGPWTIKARFIPKAGWRSAKAVKRVRVR